MIGNEPKSRIADEKGVDQESRDRQDRAEKRNVQTT
jgi:hypothetical protein